MRRWLSVSIVLADLAVTGVMAASGASARGGAMFHGESKAV